MLEARVWPMGAVSWWRSVGLGRPMPRVERGEVRHLVLGALADWPRHGYEIIQTIQQRSGGQYRPSPGVIYPTLAMLEAAGLVQVVAGEGRKAYAITEAGRCELATNQDAVREFYERFEDEPWEACADHLGDMMKHVGRMLDAFRGGASRGPMTPGVMLKVREALDEAVSKIEQAFACEG
jgi:DNA-binding PadR family transcriptional regulator